MHHNLAHCRCSGAKFRLEIDVEQIADVTAPTVVLDPDTVRNRERNKICGRAMAGSGNRLENEIPKENYRYALIQVKKKRHFSFG